MQPSKSLKLLRDFIGMVNQYRDMWSHRLHMLAPLTAKTGVHKMGEKHPPFRWIHEAQKAFDQMKAVMAAFVIIPIITNQSIYILMHLTWCMYLF